MYKVVNDEVPYRKGFFDEDGVTWASKPFRQFLSAIKTLLQRDDTESPCDDMMRAVAAVLGVMVLDRWVKGHGLKESQSNRGVRALIKGEIAGRYLLNRFPPGVDHGNLWSKGGKPVCFTFQPYHFSAGTMKDLVDFCEEYDLHLWVTGSSWHFFGRTLFVVLWRKDLGYNFS